MATDGSRKSAVAPPHAERGLKYRIEKGYDMIITVAPPHAERGLKCKTYHFPLGVFLVAPPHAERGLKFYVRQFSMNTLGSLRLTRSVD